MEFLFYDKGLFTEVKAKCCVSAHEQKPESHAHQKKASIKSFSMCTRC